MEYSFPSLLSQLRKEHGISQKQAATDLGVSQALLSHYEKGIRECGLDFIRRAAAYYHVTSDYLLGLTGTRLSLKENYGDPDATIDELMIARAAASLLFLSHKKSNGKINEQACEYYMFCLYRAALNAGQNGFLPREMFHLDMAVGRALSTAAIAVRDARAASARPRSHHMNTKETALNIIIHEVEARLLAEFPMDKAK